MCNRDNAHDVGIFPDEKITKRSEPTNQAQTKINIMRSLQTYLNDLKNYTTFQGFKVGLPPSKKNYIMYFNGKPFKNDES